MVPYTREEYNALFNSGMFWVWFPNATGIYDEDIRNGSLTDRSAFTRTDIEKFLEEEDIPGKPERKEDRNTGLSVSYYGQTVDQKHGHYYREWYGKLDYYRLCELYEINDAAIAHVFKKILCAGNRGHKDFKKDIEDCIDTLQRKLEMLEEDEKQKSR